MMTKHPVTESRDIDVVVIGGGPSGLAAATVLKQRGVDRVVVIERESQAGGIPRHCGHPPFGMREFKRVYTGPVYAKKLVERALAAGVEIRTQTTVVEARSGGELLVTDNAGIGSINARRVIYATGVRETPCSARIISGKRPLGVFNTGALQSMVYLKHCKPFTRPVIVGTELVSFSAIQTCRHMGIQPVAMIEARARATARWPFSLFRHVARIPLFYNTRLVSIEGDKRVTGVIVESDNGQQREISCDGVLLTGQFTPESTLARCGHLAVDNGSGGPVVDQFGRCSDPAYFACGNLLRPVETAGWSWQEGHQTGQWVADDLQGNLPAAASEIRITIKNPVIKLAMPQRLSLPLNHNGMQHLQLRVNGAAKGMLTARCQGKVIWQKKINTLPERRILLAINNLVKTNNPAVIELDFKSSFQEGW
jgi:thioredoxin reductase